MLQIDISGVDSATQLDLWVWDPAVPMPSTPTFSVTDTLNSGINGGFAGIAYAEDANDGEGVFCYVMASATNFVESADFDSSGIVAGPDFLTWQRGFGGAGLLATGDASLDRQVGTVDRLIWESQFGGAPPSPSLGLAATVPEPSSLALLALSALSVGLTVRGRRW